MIFLHTPPLPSDRGVHTVTTKFIEALLGESGGLFEAALDANCRLSIPPPARRAASSGSQ